MNSTAIYYNDDLMNEAVVNWVYGYYSLTKCAELLKKSEAPKEEIIKLIKLSSVETTATERNELIKILGYNED